MLLPFLIAVFVGGVHISPATQVLIKSSSLSGTSTGTGVIIRKNMVLTAAHVVDGGLAAMASCGTKMMPLVGVAIDKDADLALLKFVGDCAVEPIAVAKHNPEVTDDVYAIGCPAGHCFIATKGIVSAYFLKDDVSLRLVSDVGVWFGNSGGALIDTSGKLIGICSSLTDFSRVSIDNDGSEVITQKYSNWIPVSVILEFLGKVK